MASLPSGITYGTVVGRWVIAVADTPTDTDREPDPLYPEGTVTFTPVFRRVANTATPTINVAAAPITGKLINGVLCDATGPGVTLITGLYDVAFAIAGVPMAGYQLNVTAPTVDKLVTDVNDAAPVVPDPTVRYVVSEATYAEAQAAVVRANEAADRAEAAAGGVAAPANGWTLASLATPVRASLALANTASQPGHSHTAGNITDSTTVGRALLTAADAAAALATVGAAPATHTHVIANVTDATTLGRSLVTAASAAAARTALGVPLASDVTTALAAKADLVGGVIPTSQLPALSMVSRVTVASQAAMLALTAAQVQPGDLAVRTDVAVNYLLAAADPSVLGNWVALDATNGGSVSSVNGMTGPVTIGKADVGLGNVSNLAPADLPISTAAKSYMDASALSLTNGQRLGPLAMNVSAVNADTLTNAGWYIGTNVVNAPTPNYCYIEVRTHSDANWVLQKYTEYADVNGSPIATPRSWTRSKQANVWQAAVLVGSTGGGTRPASAMTGTAITIDATQGTTQVVTLSGNATVAFGSTPTATGAFHAYLTLKQDGTGSRTVTWPTSILWPGNGVAPTLSTTPGAIDQVQLAWDGVQWTGAMVGAAFAKVPTVVAPTTRTFYNDAFAGTNGTAPAAAWTRVPTNSTDRYPAGGTVTIQSGTMRLNTVSTAAWTGNVSVFLGDREHPEGNSATGAPAIVPDGEYQFGYTLGNLNEQYPVIGIRVREPDLWSTGGGTGLFKSGYNLVFGPKAAGTAGGFDIVQGYNTVTIGSGSGIVWALAMKFRILVSGTRLAVRAWPAANAEPSTWNYDNATILLDRADGSIGFVASNGPAAEAKSISISNFVSTTPVLSIGTTTTAPIASAEKSGFTRIYTENFTDTAPAGTGASSFLNVYSTRVQPYDEVSPTYQQRALLSAHDGVMDVGMNGTQGAAWVWGAAATANSFVGGRFSMRAKTLGAWNNGPAIMIWPSNNAWVEGEIDFPESVSGAGGYMGFQDPPWIHHHTMNTDHPYDQAAAQDVPLNVSWRDWHTYTAEWYPPGKGPNPTTGLLIYYVDDVEVYRTTTDIPKTPHRFMGQVGAYGTPGNMLIDWVTMATIN